MQTRRVCHLAGEFARLLRDKLSEDQKLVPETKPTEDQKPVPDTKPTEDQKIDPKKPKRDDWKLTEKEVVCAQIAGLCHDLGKY